MINITIDTTELETLLKLDKVLKEACKAATEEFSKDISGYITQQALTQLHSRKDAYVKGLYVKKLTDSTWIVGLESKAVWIEDGISSHNMINDLLKGKSHRVIPFDHGDKGSGNMTAAQQDLLSTIKADFQKKKQKNISDIENGPDGSPKIGLLHSFDISSGPLKKSNTPGQGKGPIGKAFQGQSGTPFLQGVRIYQKAGKNTGLNKPEVKRVIMTFRMVSEKQKETGLWDHPGNKPMDFFGKAVVWGKKKWDEQYGPQLLEKVLANI